MSDQTVARRQSNKKSVMWGVGLFLLIGIGLAWPEHAMNATKFVAWGLVVVAPIVIPGILLAAWIIAKSNELPRLQEPVVRIEVDRERHRPTIIKTISNVYNNLRTRLRAYAITCLRTHALA